MPLPGLELLRPCKDYAACSYGIHKKSYHKVNRLTDKSDQAICAEQLDRNLYKLMKWCSSLLSGTGSVNSNSSRVKKLSNNI